MSTVKGDVKTFTLRLSESEHNILEKGAKEKELSKNHFIVYLLNTYENAGGFQQIKERLDDLQRTVEGLMQRENEKESSNGLKEK